MESTQENLITIAVADHSLPETTISLGTVDGQADRAGQDIRLAFQLTCMSC